MYRTARKRHECRQDMSRAQWRNWNAIRPTRIDPDHLLDFSLDLGAADHLAYISPRPHPSPGLIDRHSLKLAEIAGRCRIKANTQLLVQLAGKRCQCRLARFGFATGLDEYRRRPFAYEQHIAFGIGNHRRDCLYGLLVHVLAGGV